MIHDKDSDKFKEACGVFGIFSARNTDVSRITYSGLLALQHRGQESAGIAVSDGERIELIKNMGLVSEVFNEDILNSLKGFSAIGHVRYSTMGSSNYINAQPLLSSHNIAVAHNGSLVNADVIRDLLEYGGSTFYTNMDSEVILGLIIRGSGKGMEQAVKDTIQAIKGSFAIVILTEDKLIGVRDSYGIKPLCIGRLKDSFILCSESCALDKVGAELIRDVRPGEIVIIDKEGLRSIDFIQNKRIETCAFEYIYFARENSVIDGISIYQSRFKAGEILYRECPVQADAVIGVPDSGIAAATGFASASGIPYTAGIVRNESVGRTFILPPDQRERAVKAKMNIVKSNIEGKTLVVIDDSIVRGTSSKNLIKHIKECGAKEVHFRVASPIIKHPCYLGIDTSYQNELIGTNSDLEYIRKEIGADSLGYLSIGGLLAALGNENKFCLGCFNGLYSVHAPIEYSRACLTLQKKCN